MNTGRDPYSVLGLRREDNPTAKDIKRAYRRLATKYHPDRNPGNEEAAAAFKEIHEVYCTLSGKQTQPDNKLTAAFEVLMDAFTATLKVAMHSRLTLRYCDLMPLVIQHLTVNFNQMEAAIAENKKLQAALEEVQRRLAGPNADDMKAMLDFQVSRTAAALAEQQRNLDYQLKAMEIAAKLRYEHDSPIKEEWERYYKQNQRYEQLRGDERFFLDHVTGRKTPR